MATTITAMENGPFVIKGSAAYTDADGNKQKTVGTAVALCRCGNSANKPFCDGSHKAINFEAPSIELILED